MSLVGFIGLGNMGGHMARNLIRGGHKLIVHDASSTAMEDLAKDGAHLATTPAEVAAEVKTIVTMLPSTPHVRKVYSGKGGVLERLEKGSLCLDSSTIDPSGSRQMAEEMEAAGSLYMDAPVSGGVMAAADGKLTFMVGGAEEGFARAEPLLKLMGANVVHTGASGTGQAAKICNNMLLAISMIGTAEAMNLGQRLGLDPKMLAKILNSSSGRCWSSEIYNPVAGVAPAAPANRDYQGGFGVPLMTKDLGLAQNAATETQAPTPLGSLAHQLYRLLANHPDYAGKDFSAVYQHLASSSTTST